MAALIVLAFYTRASWPWRIGVTVVLVLAAGGYWVWSRRGEIAEPMRAGTMPDGEHDSEEEPG